MLLMDVDGVLTDGSLPFDSEGREFKVFSAHDGLGISIWNRLGLSTGIITARKSTVVDVRARDLRIDEVHQGAKDKRVVYEEIKARLEITDREIAYIGDDLADLSVMRHVGVAIAPANAVNEIKEIAHLVTEARGGCGAVREAIEVILKARGLWDKGIERFTR